VTRVTTRALGLAAFDSTAGVRDPGVAPVRILDSAAAFDRLAPAWDRAVDASPAPVPFLLHAWLSAAIGVLPPDAELAILVSGEGDDVAAALPLVIRRRGPIRTARMLGGDRVSHSDVVGADGPPATAVLDALRRVPCDVVSATGLLETSRLARSGHLRLTPRVTSPRLLLDHGFSGVVAERLTSHDRHDIRRRQRRLAEVGEVSYMLSATPGDVAGALDDVFRLHDLRWAGQADRSDLRTPADRAFQRAMSPGLAARGSFLVHRLCLDGVAIAFRSTLVIGRRAFAYRMAFDPRYAYFAPGRLLTHHVFAELSNTGIREIEMMGGDFEHKRELTDCKPMLYSGVGRGRGTLGAIAVPALAAGAEGRIRLKRSAKVRALHRRVLALARRGRGS
jgi:CelD/BcsL family acetyltransferase involved in cellulose biosynthesis